MQGHSDQVRSVCVTKDGKIVSGSYDNTVRVWDMEGNQLGVCRGHQGTVDLVCVTNDGKIVSGSADQTVRIWDMQGIQLAVCRQNRGVSSVCVTNDGKIVSGSRDNTVRVWDLELLGKIVRMDDDQAQALWELVQNHSGTNDGQKQWEEIGRLLGIEVPVSSPRGIWDTLRYLFSLFKMTLHRLKGE